MFPDLSHLWSYEFTGIYRQQTLIRIQSILLILQGQYISPTPHQSWVFLFPYISDFSSKNVKKYMQNTYCVLMYAQKFCIIVTILLLVLHSF